MNSIEKCFDSVNKILKNLPKSWLNLTTHRLDIYDEEQAKSQFLEQLLKLQLSDDFSANKLESLPTAYDYIRLGHQLSSILEWILAEINNVHYDQVITFTSKTMPILAILRKNALSGDKTIIYYTGEKSPLLDEHRLKAVYGYQYELRQIQDSSAISASDISGASFSERDETTVIFVTQAAYNKPLIVNENIDVTVNIHPSYGSAVIIHNSKDSSKTGTEHRNKLVKEIQHVRRRETIAITPNNALKLLNEIVNQKQSFL